MDMGHGLHVAIAQIVAEELDVPFKAVKVFMGDTATSVNQGGASGSTSIQMGGTQMRMAAAEARRVLIEMAAAKLDAPIADMIVVNGIVSDASNRGKNTSYAELIGGKYFNVQLDWNKKLGNQLYAPGKAQPKDPKASIKSLGSQPSAMTWRQKCSARKTFAPISKRPGWRYGRMIRPAVAGAVPVKVDDTSIKGIPNAKVVWAEGLPRRSRWHRMDEIKAAQKLESRMVAGYLAVPGAGLALRSHPQRAGAQGTSNKRTAMSRRRSRAPPGRGQRVRMAVPVACQHGPGLRSGRSQGWGRHLLERHEKSHYLRQGSRHSRQCPAREGARDLDCGARLLWPQRCRRFRPGGGRTVEGRRQAGPAARHAAQGTGWDPKASGLRAQARAGTGRERAKWSPMN